MGLVLSLFFLLLILPWARHSLLRPETVSSALKPAAGESQGGFSPRLAIGKRMAVLALWPRTGKRAGGILGHRMRLHACEQTHQPLVPDTGHRTGASSAAARPAHNSTQGKGLPREQEQGWDKTQTPWYRSLHVKKLLAAFLCSTTLQARAAVAHVRPTHSFALTNTLQ